MKNLAIVLTLILLASGFSACAKKSQAQASTVSSTPSMPSSTASQGYSSMPQQQSAPSNPYIK